MIGVEPTPGLPTGLQFRGLIFLFYTIFALRIIFFGILFRTAEIHVDSCVGAP